MRPWLTLALPKGTLLGPSVALLHKIGLGPAVLDPRDRRLILEFPEKGIRYMILRATDVPTYVEYGAVDLGVVGWDILQEQEKDLYPLLDLGIGRCRLVVAAPEEKVQAIREGEWSKVRVATKYPRLADRYFRTRGIQAELIKLYGSIELAPLVGLADLIVDLTATGRTLRQHRLVELDTLLDSTARLVVNRASLKFRFKGIQELVQRLEEVVP